MLLGQDSTDTGTKKSGGKGSGGKGKKKANRGSGSSAASGGEDTATRSSSKPAQGGCNGAAIGINSRNGTTGNMFYCSSCGREYQRTAVEEGVARAKAAWYGSFRCTVSSPSSACYSFCGVSWVRFNHRVAVVVDGDVDPFETVDGKVTCYSLCRRTRTIT